MFDLFVVHLSTLMGDRSQFTGTKQPCQIRSDYNTKAELTVCVFKIQLALICLYLASSLCVPKLLMGLSDCIRDHYGWLSWIKKMFKKNKQTFYWEMTYVAFLHVCIRSAASMCFLWLWGCPLHIALGRGQVRGGGRRGWFEDLEKGRWGDVGGMILGGKL